MRPAPLDSPYGAQQNVVGMVGVAVPVGTPPCAPHDPPDAAPSYLIASPAARVTEAHGCGS